MNELVQAFERLLNNPMAAALMVMIAFALAVMFVIQAKKDKFDLRWLITDEQTKQPSLHKFGQLVALIISSWGFVYETLNGRMTEWYFGAYMVAWAAAEAANKFITSRSELPPNPMAPAMPAPPGPNVPSDSGANQ